MDENKTSITLKDCNEDDGGAYVWMCGRCNLNREFHLNIKKVELLKCSIASELSFLCPCCAEELESCRFDKLDENKDIVRGGLLNINSKYEFNEHKTGVILKQCTEDDAGEYVWICQKCNVRKHFLVEVHPLHIVAGHKAFQGKSCGTQVLDKLFYVFSIPLFFFKLLIYI